MTVSSLWKALDRAGCGRCIGSKELQDHHELLKKTNPWNFREMQLEQLSNRPTLAVDLSIWICEALASTAMQQHHVADPPLQLVYSRTLKLLNLGIKLVVVVEGKRRIRRTDHGDGENDKFHKRRSGARFWTACERCETMLVALGVPVVRAKAEGEALCALLNQKGIVDGVISNDGDCFLFGAKVLYTKFTIENLEQSKVMRYDATDIRACLDDDDADKYDNTGENDDDVGDIVKLSRDDLIAFAVLTGSDLAGDGLSKVGCRKAIRFIRKCCIDNPLKIDESPALAELLSWGDLARQLRNDLEEDDKGEHNETSHTCSCCGHAGNKRSHKTHGCNSCGTGPGEECFRLSPGGKFRKTLRSKALDMKSKFDPSSTMKLYHQPNENQIPHCLVGKTSATLEMQYPCLQALVQSKVIIRGATLYESRQFIQKTLSAYLARTELCCRANGSGISCDASKLPKNSNRPMPKRVNKRLVRAGIQSCEVQWVIKATMTDADGNSIDQFEFSTVEEESVIQRSYPNLLEDFKEEEKKLEAQGEAEQVKRQAFLASMFADSGEEIQVIVDPKEAKRFGKARNSFFGEFFRFNTTSKLNGQSDDLLAILGDFKKKTRKKGEPTEEKPGSNQELGKEDNGSTNVSCGDDVAKLLFANRYVNGQKRDDDTTIASSSLVAEDLDDSEPPTSGYSGEILTPGHLFFLKDYQDCHIKSQTTSRLVSCKEDLDQTQIQSMHSDDGYLKTERTSSLLSLPLSVECPCTRGQEKIRQGADEWKPLVALDNAELNDFKAGNIQGGGSCSHNLLPLDAWHNMRRDDSKFYAPGIICRDSLICLPKSSANRKAIPKVHCRRGERTKVK
jgi:flap endonuclease GEN